jgi:hypothetical protein
MNTLSEFFRKHLPAISDAPTDVPFGAKIGATLRFPIDDIIKTSESNGLVIPPDVENDTIQRIGRLRVDGVGDFYRFFVNKKDDNPQFIQLYKNNRGSLVEATYYSQIASFIPETSEEQDLFVGANGCGLGDISYDLSKSFVLENGPIENNSANRSFSYDDSINFYREGPSQADFLAPFEGVEIQSTDDSGEHGLKQRVWFSMYQRGLNNGQHENLLVATQLVESVDGDDSRRSITVAFYSGIPIDHHHIFVD